MLGPAVPPYAQTIQSDDLCRAFNLRQRYHCVVVELVNAAVKCRFGILRRLNHRYKDLKKLFVAACILYNLQGTLRNRWIRGTEYLMRNSDIFNLEALDKQYNDLMQESARTALDGNLAMIEAYRCNVDDEDAHDYPDADCF